MSRTCDHIHSIGKEALVAALQKPQAPEKKAWTDELTVAWGARDLAHVWRLGKMLGGKQIRKSKNLVELIREQWEEGVCAPGCEGATPATP